MYLEFIIYLYVIGILNTFVLLFSLPILSRKTVSSAHLLKGVCAGLEIVCVIQLSFVLIFIDLYFIMTEKLDISFLVEIIEKYRGKKV